MADISRRYRLLMPHMRLSSFVRDDVEMLKERHEILLVPCESLSDIVLSAFAVHRSDAILCWFGSTRFLPLAAVARLLGKPVLIISGGYDVAAVPDLQYGNMFNKPARWLGRALFRLSSGVASISGSAAREAELNAGVPRELITVIPLGLDPVFGASAPAWGSRSRVVLSVGYADSSSIYRKGILTTVRVAELLPELQFVIAGPATDKAMAVLRRSAPPNVRFEGEVSLDRLSSLFGAARVYLQPSLHEAFGYSVAEAMLHGCMPVVSRRYALPELVGDAGYYVDDPEDLPALAEVVRRAVASPAPEDPRQRIATRFGRSVRRVSLLRWIAERMGVPE